MLLESRYVPIEWQTIMTEQAKSERVGVSLVAQITGMSFRTIQQRAAWGLIPSAAKLGGNWSFDEAAIRLWVGQQELVTAKKKIFFLGQRWFVIRARDNAAHVRLWLITDMNRHSDYVRFRG